MLRIKRVLAVVGALALATAVFATLYNYGLVRFAYPDAGKFPIRGIDISHHQGPVDWKRLLAQGIRFAYLKASEGADWTDPDFVTNLENASRVGIPLGAYHYFTFCASGSAQAANFIRTAPQLALPPAVDMEYVGNCAVRPSREAFARELRVFLAEIESRYHVTPVLYTTKSFFNDYLSGDAFAAYPLWARDVFGDPSWAGGHTVMFHQFADHARLHGIGGPVDLNVYVGSQPRLTALFAHRDSNP